MEINPKTKFTTIDSCRVCHNSNLIDILSLGNQYISNFVDKEFIHSENNRAPLDLVLCSEENGGCSLLQLKHTASRQLLYRKYWFRSGLNETMVDVLKDITTNAEKIISLKPNDMVLDIGCNDGSLLRCYKKNIVKIGFEPAANLVNEAKIGTNRIINDFFNYEKFNEYYSDKKCKIITTIAMFYDLDDPNSFVNDISKCLDKEGIWIIQMAYLVPMLKLNGFDNIGHEHLEYYSLKPLKKLIDNHSLKIFKVEVNNVYGGSIRAYITHKQNNLLPESLTVSEIEQNEIQMGLNKISVYGEFAKSVNKIKQKLNDFVKEKVDDGKTVFVYGASTKGNTLLQFCNLNSELITKAVDRDQQKLGKITIGTKIPIISEEKGRLLKPDYFLILPWHLIEYFKKRESDYLKNGGKFIVPLPKLKIIEENDEYEI